MISGFEARPNDKKRTADMMKPLGSHIAALMAAAPHALAKDPSQKTWTTAARLQQVLPLPTPWARPNLRTA